MTENILDKLEEQDFNFADLSEQIREIKAKTDYADQDNAEEETDDKRIIKRFIYDSVKYYNWFGTGLIFKRDKIIVVFLALIEILLGISSAILTSLTFQLYSPFSIPENIFVICSFFQLLHCIKAKKFYNDYALSNNSACRYERGADCVWKDTHKEKKRFKIFRIICYFSILCNIIYISFLHDNSGVFFAITLELLYLISIIVFHFVYMEFFSGYHVVYFCENCLSDSRVVLVYDNVFNVLLSKDEYERRTPYIR